MSGRTLPPFRPPDLFASTLGHAEGVPRPSGLLRRSMELDAREASIEARLDLLAKVEERIALKQHMAALLGDWGGVLSGASLASALERVIDRHGDVLSQEDRWIVHASLWRASGDSRCTRRTV